MRQLLGKAVRVQAEQQIEIDSLHETVRDQKTVVSNARQMASSAEQDAQQLRQQVEELKTQLADEQVPPTPPMLRSDRPSACVADGSTRLAWQRERQENAAAALEREQSLEVCARPERRRQRRRAWRASATLASHDRLSCPDRRAHIAGQGDRAGGGREASDRARGSHGRGHGDDHPAASAKHPGAGTGTSSAATGLRHDRWRL